MTLSISLATVDNADATAYAKLLRTELLAVDPPLTTADAVSRYVSGKGNPRIRPNTTSDRAVEVEMRVMGAEWATILTVHVR